MDGFGRDTSLSPDTWWERRLNRPISAAGSRVVISSDPTTWLSDHSGKFGRPRLALRREIGLQVFISVMVAAYAVSTLTIHRHQGYNVFWDGWVQHIDYALPVIPMMWCVKRSPEFRTAWRFMAVGTMLNAVGSLLFSYHGGGGLAQTVASNVQSRMTLSDATIVNFLSYATFIVGVALLTQGRVGRANASVRLDGLIAGLALASAAGLLWLDRVLTVSGNPSAIAVAIAFPVSDLVLITLLVAGLAPNRYRPNWSTVLLVLGALSFVVGDVINLNWQSTDRAMNGTFLASSWVIGVWLMGLAASVHDRRRVERARSGKVVSSSVASVPVVSGLLSVGVMATAVANNYTSPVVLFLALAALTLVIIRMRMTLREERRSLVNFQDARTDALTGLPNRRSLFEEVQSMIEPKEGRAAGVVLIDLDGFKEVNDALGHGAGDELLCAIAKRFESETSQRGMLARLGGDEFAFTSFVRSEEELVTMANALQATLIEPCVIDGVSVQVHASMGVAVASKEKSSVIEVLRSADVAMYEAKRLKIDVETYKAENDPHSREALALVADLRDAIDQHALVLYYQPTLDMQSANVRGVEALARWQHPELGMLYPDAFIPIVERIGLMPKLTRFVLQQAVVQAAHLHQSGHDLQMSVNISRHDLVDKTLPDFIEQLLHENDYPAHQLTLEITESVLGSDPVRSAECVHELRAKGVRISIDDFGVGYSSMSQLLGLAIDELKVDKSFIIGLCGDSRAQAIVRSAIELSRALDLSLVAEGIEEGDVLRILQSIGADVGQGHYIARPLTSVDLDIFLAAGSRGHGIQPASCWSAADLTH